MGQDRYSAISKWKASHCQGCPFLYAFGKQIAAGKRSSDKITHEPARAGLTNEPCCTTMRNRRTPLTEYRYWPKLPVSQDDGTYILDLIGQQSRELPPYIKAFMPRINVQQGDVRPQERS